MTSALFEHLPDDFVWGVATSAYQIEGGISTDGRGLSIWDSFSHTDGRTHHGDTADVACDHRNRWESDVDLLAELGVPAYRLSLSWPRLQPGGQGPLNESALQWYRALLTGLRSRGVTPYVTLYHWDLPQELEDAGGWPRRETAERFAEYTGRIVDALGDLVHDWITVNEPWCASFLGYGLGVHAPGRRSMRDAVASAHHLNLAHGLAVAQIRDRSQSARVGVTNIIADLIPRDPGNVADIYAVERLDAVNHQLFLAPVFTGAYPALVHELLDPCGLHDVINPGDLETIAAPIDFLGVNHYQQVLVGDDPTGGVARVSEEAAGIDRTSFGWSITPAALTEVLRHTQERYTAGLPLLVTENGASFTDYVTPDHKVHDPERIAYLDGYLVAIDDAVAAGINVTGYFAWSFLDNYEWAEGYDKRFGLVYVDFATQERVPKDSAHHYASLITTHQVRAALAPLGR